MEKKKFVVAYHFKAEFEAYNESDALYQAALKIQSGFQKTEELALNVIAVVPLTPPTGEVAKSA